MSLDPKTAKRTLLTAEDRAALQPVLFGDDQRLAFVTNAFGPLALVRAESLAPASTLSVVIGSDLAPALGEPSISPDGARLALSMNDKSGARFIAVVGADGSKLTPIGEGRSPAWSPSGQQLAFVRSAGGYNHLFIVDAATLKDPAQVTTGDFDCDRPTFSPDGQRIAFSSNRGFKEGGRSRSDTLHLQVVGVGGGAITPVTRGSARAATPAWGKDGFLYFASDRDGSFDLFRVRAPPGGARRMRPGAAKERELLRIGELARRAAVPVATIKHYLREGLLAPVQSGKKLRPVRRGRRGEGAAHQGAPREELPAAAGDPRRARGRADARVGRADHPRRADGPALELRSHPRLAHALRRLRARPRLAAAGRRDRPGPEAPEESYAGDDLELLRVLGAARRAGLTADMLPLSIVADYIEAIRNLVRVELQLFETGVLPRAGENVGELTEQATKLPRRARTPSSSSRTASSSPLRSTTSMPSDWPPSATSP
jgi:Tol biopolymer transport system component